MRQIHFNRENFSFALSNILEHKFRSLLTILGIIVGIVTVVLVASVLVGVRNNIALLFQEFGPDSIFAFHLNGDPGGTDIKPEERSRKPLRAEFAAKILSRCPSVKDAAAQIYVPNLVRKSPPDRQVRQSGKRKHPGAGHDVEFRPGHQRGAAGGTDVYP